MTTALAVSELANSRPIDLRSGAPAELRDSVESLLEVVALSDEGDSSTDYLPDSFLTLLIGS
jgi:hypothetical protein